jgi:hypothetical protein
MVHKSLINTIRLKGKLSDMKTWIDELYIEIKTRWNRLRAEGGNPDECSFLIHLMEAIEKNTDD